MSNLENLRKARRALTLTLGILEEELACSPNILLLIDTVRGRSRALLRAALELQPTTPDQCERALKIEAITLTEEQGKLCLALESYARGLEGHRMGEPDADAAESLLLSAQMARRAAQTVCDQVGLMKVIGEQVTHSMARQLRDAERESWRS